MDVEEFLRRWSHPSSERGSAHSFIIQLCRLLEVPAPGDDLSQGEDYCFERRVRFQHIDGSVHWGYIDCYR